MTPVRWVGLALFAGGVFFAAEGGEYSTGDYFTLRRQVREESLRVAELEGTVDSLQRIANALEHDPRAQERAAREQYGMLRKGEYFYRLVRPDSQP